jgi:hypothetical protein
MDVLIEHLDRYVHKKQLMGPVDETIAWLLPIHKNCPNMYLGWDAAPLMTQMHISNAVLNPSDPLHEDHHMRCGAPGFLTLDFAAELLKTAISNDTEKQRKSIYTSVEVRPKDNDDLWALELECREFLKKAIELATAQ